MALPEVEDIDLFPSIVVVVQELLPGGFEGQGLGGDGGSQKQPSDANGEDGLDVSRFHHDSLSAQGAKSRARMTKGGRRGGLWVGLKRASS